MYPKDDGSSEASYARALFWLAITGVVLIALYVCGFVGKGKQDPEPHPSASVVASLGGGTQQSILDSLPARCKVQGVPLADDCIDFVPADMRGVVSCANEDGNNVKGQLCLWMDPQTRKIFFVVSD